MSFKTLNIAPRDLGVLGGHSRRGRNGAKRSEAQCGGIGEMRVGGVRRGAAPARQGGGSRDWVLRGIFDSVKNGPIRTPLSP